MSAALKSKVQLFPHQVQLLEQTKDKSRVAYYASMGLGKTFIASEKYRQLGYPIALVVCQKSKIDDWVKHFETYYDYPVIVFDSQKVDQLPDKCVLIINYDKVWRRPELLKLTNYTLILDESSYIANESAKRTKFIMKLQPNNVILLSGTPTGGKYEQLWTQANLLGWKISKELFWKHYIVTKTIEDPAGYKIPVITGYKNVDRLKSKLREYGAVFMTDEDAGIKLPEKVDTVVSVRNTKEYSRFKRDRIIEIDGKMLVGDTALTKMLYLRQLAGLYNPGKYEALQDLLESTSDRVLIFYNFRAEYDRIRKICEELGKPISVVNGDQKDLTAYETSSESITLLQYQSGALGLNLQLANKIIYFSPPLESILFEQSKRRTRRIGQSKTCFYWYLVTRGSIEEQIYETLKQRKNFTEELFQELEDEQ